MKPKSLKDRRRQLPECCTVAKFNTVRKENLKDGFWACVCGSRKFHLLQSKLNVKAICDKCGETDIIYWNGAGDSASGAMRRLDTNTWVKPKVTLE